MSPYRRSPRPLGFALERMRIELAPDTLLAEVQQAWHEAVGDGIAAAAQPTGERSGVVTVSCTAAAWSQELDLMAPVLIERLNERLLRGRVTRLRCVTLPPREY
jgi:predicted nucleic acid-binding Zn ribbon protein